jgi:hypothetical protein
MTNLDKDTTWTITKRFVAPEQKDTSMKDHVIKVDTMISEGTIIKIEPREPKSYTKVINGEVFKYHINELGDTIIVDNFYSLKSPILAPENKTDQSKIMITPSDSDFLKPGDNRSASEIISVDLKSSGTAGLKSELEYDLGARAVLFVFMVYVTTMYLYRSAPDWAAMTSKIRSVISS